MRFLQFCTESDHDVNYWANECLLFVIFQDMLVKAESLVPTSNSPEESLGSGIKK